MRFVRYQLRGAPTRQGWVFEDRIGPLDGDINTEFRRQEATIPIEEARLLAPVLPGKIICVGRNYVEHAREQQAEAPALPLLFLKPPSSLIGPEDTIFLPPQSQRVEHEGELALVIRKRARWVAPENANDYILGYTLANDVTARDLQRADGQWTRAKSFDTFCPLGPWIESDFDAADALLTVHVNGVVRQMGSTSDMVFKCQQLLAFASTIMTLEPGDVILTGTPAGVGPLVPGDIVEVKIPGLGALRNPVARDPHAAQA